MKKPLTHAFACAAAVALSSPAAMAYPLTPQEALHQSYCTQYLNASNQLKAGEIKRSFEISNKRLSGVDTSGDEIGERVRAIRGETSLKMLEADFDSSMRERFGCWARWNHLSC